jgi:hypothetical protein
MLLHFQITIEEWSWLFLHKDFQIAEVSLFLFISKYTFVRSAYNFESGQFILLAILDIVLTVLPIVLNLDSFAYIK